MSTTLTKNLVLSQPKAGLGETVPISILTHSVTTENNYVVVKVEIPGVDPATVDVKCENNVLHIECERGEFSLPVDPTVDITKIQAEILWGLLTVKLPQPAPPVSRQIKVNIHDALPKVTTKPASKFTEKE